MAEPRVALITDTHFGIKKGSQIFHNYFEKFYKEVFFPTLDKEGIKTVIHLGDCFDVRKGIDYWSLDWAKRVFFNPLQERGIQTHIIVGNHDIFYKDSLKINAPGLNLNEYENITCYSTPQDVCVENENVFFIPWICDDNAEEFVEARDRSEASVAMGHLEIAGFYANQNYQCQHGTDARVFEQFEKVFSGHFHKKNSSGNITYLGNPYQLYWNDEGDTRGFHIFNLRTKELEWVKNPISMYQKIYYNEDEMKGKLFNPNNCKDRYLKVIVEKSTPNKLASFVDKLYQVGVHDLKIIESFEVSLDDDVEVEAEDTLTTLTNYVNALDYEKDKDNLINILKSLYVEAQEV